MKSIQHNFVVALLAVFVAIFSASQVFALNIDSTDKYAWGENIGWLNFSTAEGDVDVTTTAMDGYVWGENVGWISLDGITVDTSTGDVAGYAWGENVGWISFFPATHGARMLDG